MLDIFPLTHSVVLCYCYLFVFYQGFFFGHKSYLAEGFNYLDLFIVVLGILDFVPSDDEGGGNLSGDTSTTIF